MVQIAKYMRPVLTDEASSLIAEEYAELRTADFSSEMARTQVVTARALETLIRLSTAHAKVDTTKNTNKCRIKIYICVTVRWTK